MNAASPPVDPPFSRRGGSVAALLVLFGVAAGGGALGLGAATGIAALIAASRNWFAGALNAASQAPLPINLLWVFAIWAGVSVAWSPTSRLDYVGILLGLAVLPTALAWAAASANLGDRTLIRRAALTCVALLIVSLLIEALFGYPLSKLATPGENIGNLARNLSRGGVCALALAFASLWAIDRTAPGNAVLASVLAGAGIVAFQFNVSANQVGYLVALAASGFALLLPRIAVTSVFVGAGGLVCAAPVLYPLASRLGRMVSPGGELPLSLELRARMWDFSVARIAEKPWAGWGFQSARSFDEPIVVRGWTATQLQIHPHSAPLQVWLETGLIGAALVAAALFSAGWLIGKSVQHDRLLAASVAGSTAVVLTVYAFSYSLWDDWLVSLCAIMTAILLASRALPWEQPRAKAVSDSEFVPL